jgi:chemotaxis protein methyltransferase CheR
MAESSQTAMNLTRMEISDRDFIRLSRLIYEQSGINLNQSKKTLLRARLQKRMRECELTSFRLYYQRVLEDRSGWELMQLLDAISTNQTFFFREAQHFYYLAEEILPKWRQSWSDKRRLQIWSAGCSSGEEPYTLAIVLLEFLSSTTLPCEVKIIATDINTKVLEQARQGIYPHSRTENIPLALRKKYFQKGVNHWAGYIRVKPELQRLVEFSRLNLMEPFAFQDPLEIIFCRNVMIYFDKPTQEKLVQRFYQNLGPGGYLFLGHSESLAGVSHRLSYLKPAIYQK